MPALNNKVRTDLLKLIDDELDMVNNRAKVVAGKKWEDAEQEVARKLGYTDVLTRIEHVKNQIEGLQIELSELEGTIKERARDASIEDYHSVGIETHANRYGQVMYRPEVFGRKINTRWDIAVLKHLNEQLPFLQIYQGLSQLHHVVKRELLLTGNFEEARALYQRFHQKIIEAVGESLPGLLSEIRSLPALQPPD